MTRDQLPGEWIHRLDQRDLREVGSEATPLHRWRCTLDAFRARHSEGKPVQIELDARAQPTSGPTPAREAGSLILRDLAELLFQPSAASDSARFTLHDALEASASRITVITVDLAQLELMINGQGAFPLDQLAHRLSCADLICRLGHAHLLRPDANSELFPRTRAVEELGRRLDLLGYQLRTVGLTLSLESAPDLGGVDESREDRRADSDLALELLGWISSTNVNAVQPFTSSGVGPSVDDPNAPRLPDPTVHAPLFDLHSRTRWLRAVSAASGAEVGLLVRPGPN